MYGMQKAKPILYFISKNVIFNVENFFLLSLPVLQLRAATSSNISNHTSLITNGQENSVQLGSCCNWGGMRWKRNRAGINEIVLTSKDVCIFLGSSSSRKNCRPRRKEGRGSARFIFKIMRFVFS